MKVDKQKEEEFYSKPFNFSYSSLNRLLFSPSLFYKDYILQDREIRTDKHLVEGKLVHCLVFQPEKLEELFSIVPGKVPSENVKRVLKGVKEVGYEQEGEISLDKLDSVILACLKEENLYQSLKTDEQRLAKVQTDDHQVYYKFICTTGMDVVDNDTVQKCQEQANIIKENEKVMELFDKGKTDFELDTLEIYKEKPLECKLSKYEFGLKGIVDYYNVDHEAKTISIVDLKTTSKTVSDFAESIEYYNYWLQAAIYTKLVLSTHEDIKDYKILFTFVVIDKYNQVVPFNVSDVTMRDWAKGMKGILDIAAYHYKEKNYSLPYEFLINSVVMI